jgi:hypothetical protein
MDRRRHGRARRIAIAVVAGLVLLALPGEALARDGREVRITDRCDAATFPEAAGCIRDSHVTFAEFLEKLNPADGGHHQWRFKEDHVELKRGERLSARNIGGEAHTFTEVVNFGAGFIPPDLNAALPPGTPPAVQVNADPLLVVPGAKVDVGTLDAGTHLFQCMIHPWMRSVVEQRGR